MTVPRISFGVWRADLNIEDERLALIRIDPAQIAVGEADALVSVTVTLIIRSVVSGSWSRLL